MKMIEGITVSSRLARMVRTMDTEDKWIMQKSLIADASQLVVNSMMEDVNEAAKMREWNMLLSLLASYQEIIDQFHRECDMDE